MLFDDFILTLTCINIIFMAHLLMSLMDARGQKSQMKEGLAT